MALSPFNIAALDSSRSFNIALRPAAFCFKPLSIAGIALFLINAPWLSINACFNSNKPAVVSSSVWIIADFNPSYCWLTSAVVYTLGSSCCASSAACAVLSINPKLLEATKPPTLNNIAAIGITNNDLIRGDLLAILDITVDCPNSGASGSIISSPIWVSDSVNPTPSTFAFASSAIFAASANADIAWSSASSSGVFSPLIIPLLYISSAFALIISRTACSASAFSNAIPSLLKSTT